MASAKPPDIMTEQQNTEAKPFPKRSNRGKGAKAKQQQAFQVRKNDQTQALIQATMLRRLGIADPTRISTIQVQSAIIPTVIPISLLGLPALCEQVWSRMKAIGTRPFTALATNANYAIFVKCMLTLAEAKVTYAQMACPNAPVYSLTSLESFSEMQLRGLKTLSSRLPYPLAMYLESIGVFTIDGQTVVPQLCEHSTGILSGVLSLGLSKLVEVLNVLRTPVSIYEEMYNVANVLNNRLPAFEWGYQDNAEGVRTHVALTEPSYQFWSMPAITAEQRSIFLQIISSMESKKDFLLLCDIATGAGSSVQAVRFPDAIQCAEDEVQYYMNSIVPSFEEQLAPALMLGVDSLIVKKSRFVTDYYDCLKHGTASRTEALHALVWAE